MSRFSILNRATQPVAPKGMMSSRRNGCRPLDKEHYTKHNPSEEGLCLETQLQLTQTNSGQLQLPKSRLLYKRIGKVTMLSNDDVPEVVDAITRLVAGFLVLGIEVDRLAPISPLPRTVVAGDNRPVAVTAGIEFVSGVGRLRAQWRPIRRTLSVACAFSAAGDVIVKSIKRLAVRSDHCAAR